MARFNPHIPALYVPDQPFGPGVVVRPEESERVHARALRLKQGDRVILLDGRGGRGEGVVEVMERKEMVVRIEDARSDELPPFQISLAQGILADKGRWEWIVEKGVELGVKEIIPLQTERTEGHFYRERSERIAVAGLKQSQQGRLPLLADPLDWKGLGTRSGAFDLILLCHEQQELIRSLPELLMEQLPSNGTVARDEARGEVGEKEEEDQPFRILIVIGPEGGLTDEEIAEGTGWAGVTVVSLGPTRLRAETAALVALSTVVQWGYARG